jgi:hypothetical protein
MPKVPRREEAGAHGKADGTTAPTVRGPDTWPPGLFDEITDILANALVADAEQFPELYPSLWKASTDKKSLTRILAELVCLVYHEARNVRHPIKAGKLPNAGKYAKLTSVPTNRLDAWKAMAGIRTDAARGDGAPAVVEVFEQRFGLTLVELEALYHAPIWKASAYGGNRWAPICVAIRDLAKAIERCEVGRTADLLGAIPRLRHNTGTVGEKLARLHVTVPTTRRDG